MRVRVAAEHKRAFEEAAEREGLDVSAWLRQLALRAAGVIPPRAQPAHIEIPGVPVADPALFQPMPRTKKRSG